ncbi:MAG: 30S ribosomal protein S14 [Ignavibacteriaceae bacterium]|nr:30S ribosomal protein S14 [Ignavibacteriaceae bacterium]
MARKSLFAREEKRKKLHEKFEALRKELKAKGDWDALQSLPRNSSKIRQHNRCALTGRARAYYRKFGISRLVLREKALQGLLPGVQKASW